MVKLHFEKVYNTDRDKEPCYVGFPLPKGKISDIGNVSIVNEKGEEYPSQNKVTALWEDGTVKWFFTAFLADLPKNASADYFCKFDNKSKKSFDKIICDGSKISNGILTAELAVNSDYVFKKLTIGKKIYENFIDVPSFNANGKTYRFKAENFKVEECGEVYSIIRVNGSYEGIYDAEVQLKFYKDKPWFEMSVKFVNTTNDPIKMENWKTGCSFSFPEGDDVRTTTAHSNYKTKYNTSDSGERVYEDITAEFLMLDANEHNPEVFYGTFFGDVSDISEGSGVCATVYQAQQYFPKAVCAERDRLTVYLIPDDKAIQIEHSMAITQKILFHIHNGEELSELNNRSTIYQMPDKPFVSPEVFKSADVFPKVFTDNRNSKVEIFLTGKADEHSRSYGLLSWGDSPDGGYTNQGRGGGELVWTNNEYDFPHSCAMMYARTGTRRYLDYVLTACRHWQDVDICHYSDDPLKINGQYEHTNRHNASGTIVCSHQWVEGLFDYYHFTGDKDAFDAAIKIAENVERLLETPQFKKKGETSARETGWALRTLTACYTETNDDKWLEKCDFIVGHFEEWEREHGHWLSSYMDNVSIRVVFMISVAIVSLMKYNRVRPQKRITDMIMRSVDDMIENCILDNGLFYYKETPSLKRLGNNPIILEALAIAFEITGDVKYLKVGMPTFEYVMSLNRASGFGGCKKIAENSVIVGSVGSKSFAQLMPPFTIFYTYANENGLINF